MEYRIAKREDWKEIINLVNGVFINSAPMEKAFPLLFNKSNNTSYVAVDRGEIVAFIGGVPYMFKDKELSYPCVSLGAVCTRADYRGRGISDNLLKLALKDYEEAGFTFALISGSRNLYLRNGFVPFGAFNQYILAEYPAISDISKYDIHESTGSIRELLELHALYEKREVKLSASINEFKLLLEGRAVARIMKMDQKIYVAREEEKAVSYVIVGIREREGIKEGLVIDFSGDEEGVYEVFKTMYRKEGLDKLTVAVKSDNSRLNDLFKTQSYTLIENQGTFLSLSGAPDKAIIPYTSNLNYV
ncbi:MAG: GNAT family N-acetyltransferase [Clostridiaceae bacterium]